MKFIHAYFIIFVLYMTTIAATNSTCPIFKSAIVNWMYTPQPHVNLIATLGDSGVNYTKDRYGIYTYRSHYNRNFCVRLSNAWIQLLCDSSPDTSTYIATNSMVAELRWLTSNGILVTSEKQIDTIRDALQKSETNGCKNLAWIATLPISYLCRDDTCLSAYTLPPQSIVISSSTIPTIKAGQSPNRCSMFKRTLAIAHTKGRIYDIRGRQLRSNNLTNLQIVFEQQAIER